MPGSCENLPGLVDSYVYHTRQLRAIYQALPDSVDLKAAGKLWNPMRKTVLNTY